MFSCLKMNIIMALSSGLCRRKTCCSFTTCVLNSKHSTDYQFTATKPLEMVWIQREWMEFIIINMWKFFFFVKDDKNSWRTFVSVPVVSSSVVNSDHFAPEPHGANEFSPGIPDLMCCPLLNACFCCYLNSSVCSWNMQTTCAEKKKILQSFLSLPLDVPQPCALSVPACI